MDLLTYLLIYLRDSMNMELDHDDVLMTMMMVIILIAT